MGTMNASIEGQQVGPVTDRRRRALRRRSAGVVMVEYAFLLTFFGLPVMLATAAAGIKLIQVYGDIRNDALHEFP